MWRSQMTETISGQLDWGWSLKIQDQFVDEDVMEESQEEKYVGDIVSNDEKNMKNINSRVNKGKGIVSE